MDKLEHAERASEQGRGREASSPREIPAKGWKDILWRTYQETMDDRVMLIAAAVTYYLLLALFPALTAFVSVYGLFTDRATVNEHIGLLSAIVPSGGLEIISDQLKRLTAEDAPALSLALIISLIIALWSASAGVKALFEAMNITYDEKEKRGFIALNAQALLFTLGGVVAALSIIAVVLVIPLALSFVGLGKGVEWVVQIAGYALLVIVLLLGLGALYRYGPSRRQAKWRWITPGAGVAVAAILAMSVLFSWYAANFAKYDATYGSLGALIGLLTWIWLSITIVLVGAELNAETEHQSAKDSTIGADKPMGERQASMADTVGKSTAEGGAPEPAAVDTRSPEWRAGYKAAREGGVGDSRGNLTVLALVVPSALILAALLGRNGTPAKRAASSKR